jgi:anion-transporting  ArsA/GET3 family ATPase
MVVEGRRALEEYLSLVIPVRRLLKTIFSTNVYQYFVAAAPGLRELMTVGKIWYEVQRAEQGAAADERGAHPPDIVVVDGPATGHSLQYLRMPRAAAEAFPIGLVHREAERVWGLLTDTAATAVVVVTTAEEMPANETAEIYEGLGALGLPRSLLVVNQVHAAPASEEELAALRGALPERAADAGTDARPKRGRTSGGRASGGAAAPSPASLLAEVVARGEEETGWAAINRANIERLAQAVPLPTVLLPFVFAEEFGAEHVIALARTLGAALEGAGSAEGAAARRASAAGARSAPRKLGRGSR